MNIWAGGVAWIVECLPVKCEALSLNSSTVKQNQTMNIYVFKMGTEANRKRGPGTTEKFRLKRINLVGNTHAQEINVSQLLV
jgi:hypothetical protein